MILWRGLDTLKYVVCSVGMIFNEPNMEISIYFMTLNTPKISFDLLQDMAKKIVPAFGRLLDTSADIAIKNNIMYALSDMCVRYA